MKLLTVNRASNALQEVDFGDEDVLCLRVTRRRRGKTGGTLLPDAGIETELFIPLDQFFVRGFRVAREMPWQGDLTGDSVRRCPLVARLTRLPRKR